ncbi:MAG: NAD-binding protein, partial [Bacteroidales bacterium]|nr:NAD-binding protein [Bacteroidales bacterium]
MKHTTNSKYILWIPIIILFFVGFLLGIIGFSRAGVNCCDSIYKTVQMFMLHEKFKDGINPYLQCSRWILLIAFILASLGVYITLVTEKWKQWLIKSTYRNHIVICGLNKITINLVKKYSEKQIVVLAEETNKYAETLKAKNVKLLIGDFADESFWEKAKLKKASKLYAIIDNDKINVKIAKFAFSYLKNREKNNALKYFVLIKDREMKPILEELPLFKNKSDYFDATLFNINEMGAKYGIAMNIDKILPAKMITSPEILLVGLTEKTEVALLNLAHCLTMKQEKFKFTIV